MENENSLNFADTAHAIAIREVARVVEALSIGHWQQTANKVALPLLAASGLV